MIDREAELLDAMIEAPDDPGPRLVFSDVLLERGDARGEIIRTHADASSDSTSKAAVHGRRLSKTFLSDLKGRGIAIHGNLSEQTGWLWHLTMNAETFLGNLETLFAIGPIHHVRLRNSKPHVDALAACVHLRWVDKLEIMNNELGYQDVIKLLASSHVQRLAGLDLHGNKFGVIGTAAIAETPFTRLRDLDVSFADIGNEGFAALAKAPYLPRLEELGLISSDADADALTGLLANARDLRELGLSYNADLGGAGGVAIAEATHLDRLESLPLAGCGLANQGVTALASTSHLGKVRWLVLDRNNITSKGARALAATTTFAADCRLSIAENRSIDAASRALLRQRFRLV